MPDKQAFFIKENKIEHIPDENYDIMDMYVQLLDAFARTTYETIYVIDYYRQNFLYMSDNPLFLCGMSASEVRKMGCDFYLKQVPENELDMLLEINRAGFAFTESIPIQDRLEYTISYDFHILQVSGKPMLINHKITPLRLTDDGKIWLALCSASLSSQAKPGNFEVSRSGHHTYWTYNLQTRRWTEHQGIELKENEKDVLRLSAQGYTINEISEQLFKSIDTIKSYRRQLFEKLDVDNITEAISLAVNKKLI